MKQAVEFEEAAEVDDVPVSAGLKVLRPSRYGTIQGLDEEELADPDELERMVWQQEFGPILALPQRGDKRGFRLNLDEQGRVDFGAFATVDFERTRRYSFDKLRYKADRMKEELRFTLAVFAVVNHRIASKAKYKVLKYLKMGYLELEDIMHPEVRELGRLYLRAIWLRQEIDRLKKASFARKMKRLKPTLEAWGLWEC